MDEEELESDEELSLMDDLWPQREMACSTRVARVEPRHLPCPADDAVDEDDDEDEDESEGGCKGDRGR